MKINFNTKACILDYGHGGTDPGAVSGTHKEKEWNYDTGKACKDELSKYGVTVYETRTADQTLSLDQRCAIANKYNAQYFVSIHHNAGGGDRGETIYSIYEGDGKALANNIASELKIIGQSTVKEYSKKLDNSNQDYYGVIRGTKMHSIIVEVCFIDNAKDREIADTLEERKRNGRAIAHGILKQMGIKINNKQQEEFDMDKIVVYYGDADLFAAVMVAQKNKCALMKKSDYDVARIKVKEIIQIGGKKEDTNRFTTMKNACKYL